MSEKVIIRKSSLSGEIKIPPSKSQTLRALLFALLAKGKSSVVNPLSSPDVQAMVRACQLLGAHVERGEERIEIVGGLKAAEDVIDAGNSGQVLRFVGAVSALLSSYTVVTGDASIRHRRPVKPLLEGLEQLGAWAESTKGDGYAPIIVRGKLKGGVAVVDGEDSQPISGLLIASSFAEAPSEIFVKNAGEKPWIELTLSWLKKFGLTCEHHNFEHYKIRGGGEVAGFDYTVPGDWSSALYPIAAAVMTDSELTLQGVDFADPQGDKAVVTLLETMGAKISVYPEKRAVTIHRGARLKGAQIDVGPFIDAITLLPVLACRAKGPTHIFGGKIARAKECDRIHAIVKELKKMGAKIEEMPDGMVVEPCELKGSKVFCHDDHRMALALSVAALGAEGPTEIVGIEAVSKSFPSYFKALHQLGANVE